MFVQVAKAIGCNVIAVVKRDSQVTMASARVLTKSCRLPPSRIPLKRFAS